jgi:hypothetical protein
MRTSIPEHHNVSAAGEPEEQLYTRLFRIWRTNMTNSQDSTKIRAATPRNAIVRSFDNAEIEKLREVVCITRDRTCGVGEGQPRHGKSEFKEAPQSSSQIVPAFGWKFDRTPTTKVRRGGHSSLFALQRCSLRHCAFSQFRSRRPSHSATMGACLSCLGLSSGKAHSVSTDSMSHP